MSDLPAFDEVHVISDLHMGGRAGAQMFRETGRLANLILRLARQSPDSQVALVLNGDVFDTLAEDVVGYIAVDDAPATVARIIADTSFAPIWQALATFIRAAGRLLAFVIGNHDLEMALPTVQRLLLTSLSGDDSSIHARIRFATVGEGFACTVGGTRLFCSHGNEVDAWNCNRYDDLATLARRVNAGSSMAGDEWHPNAGTRLVKDVMNGLKRHYAWVDLLKPETAAALGTLLALDPSQAKHLGALCGIVGERRRGQARMRDRLAENGPASPEPKAPQTLEARLGPNLQAALDSRLDGNVEDMLLTAEHHLHAPGRLASDPAQTLGAPQFLWDRLRGIGTAEALRHALLDWLADDKSFEADAPDDTFLQITAAVGPVVDFIVTGHTHLERAIDRGDGRYYFNCGTWIRLLRLTPSMLAERSSFEPVWAVLRDGRMQAIDEAVFGGEPFVLDRSSLVTIRAEGSAVIGELRHVEGDGSGEPRTMQRFTRERRR